MQTRSQIKQLIFQTAIYMKDMRMQKKKKDTSEPENTIDYEAIPPKYDFVYDFTDASNEWRKNKISCGNGTYTYRWAGITKTDNPCTQK